MSKTKIAGILVAVAVLLVIGGIAANYFIVDQAINKQHSQQFNPDPTQTAVPQEVTQPPDAADIAKKLHCTRYHGFDTSNSTKMVITAGACWIGNTKYAIDTFESASVRDEWLKESEPFGVVPKWETANSVTYKSVDS